jgi:PAS domain S-box-containing protein
MAKYAQVPEEFNQLFRAAELFIADYFSRKHEDPSHGLIDIWDDRYLMIRASSFSVELYKILCKVTEEKDTQRAVTAAQNLLFRLAQAVGKSDAAYFIQRNTLTEPLAKLSPGPIHFAFTGWASVKLLTGSCLEPNDNFYLIYEHPYSFEADSWLRSGHHPDFPVCFLNAGYSAGWCGESYCLELVATELHCQAKGDDCCRFIMAPPGRIGEHIERYKSEHREQSNKISTYFIPEVSLVPQSAETMDTGTQFLKTAFDNARDGFIIIRHDTIMDVNPAAIRILDVPKAELSGRKIFDLSPRIQLNNQKSEDHWKLKFHQAVTENSCVFEWQFRQRDGSCIDTEISLSVIEQDGPTMLAVCRDITHRKRSEEQLIQSQKMEAIGSLASGIAHEFNNILAGMLGFTTLLKIKLPKSDLNQRYLERIDSAVQKQGDLTRQLLSFSKREPSKKIVFDVNLCARNMIKLLGRTLDKRLEIKLNLSPDLKPLEGDPSQIEQMIMNLCLNSAQAMSGGGILEIRTWMVDQEQLDNERIDRFKNSEVLCFAVSDTGVGMSREILEHIFEPFFSLRENGVGTGLGLPISYNIVRNHNGTVRITSAPGKGTEIRVFFPATLKPLPVAGIPSLGIKPGTETILIADDEELILDFLKELLTPLGYVVISANDGIEAVDIYKTRSEEIDLVILNTGMPRLGGLETSRHLIAIQRRVKIILISGQMLSLDEIDELKKNGISAFIQKPFRPEEICSLIRDVLRTGD